MNKTIDEDLNSYDLSDEFPYNNKTVNENFEFKEKINKNDNIMQKNNDNSSFSENSKNQFQRINNQELHKTFQNDHKKDKIKNNPKIFNISKIKSKNNCKLIEEDSSDQKREVNQFSDNKSRNELKRKVAVLSECCIIL